MTGPTVAALRCKTCGCLRVIASSNERARRTRLALGTRDYRLVTVPAAEAQ